MPCPSCNKSIPQDAIFCPYCGTAIMTELYCTNCNTKLVENAKFCHICRTPVEPTDTLIIYNDTSIQNTPPTPITHTEDNTVSMYDHYNTGLEDVNIIQTIPYPARVGGFRFDQHMKQNPIYPIIGGYKNRLYYAYDTEIFSTDINGNNLCLIVDLSIYNLAVNNIENNYALWVNGRGIFLYFTDTQTMYRFDFKGDKLAYTKLARTKKDSIHITCIDDINVWFIINETHVYHVKLYNMQCTPIQISTQTQPHKFKRFLNDKNNNSIFLYKNNWYFSEQHNCTTPTYSIGTSTEVFAFDFENEIVWWFDAESNTITPHYYDQETLPIAATQYKIFDTTNIPNFNTIKQNIHFNGTTCYTANYNDFSFFTQTAYHNFNCTHGEYYNFIVLDNYAYGDITGVAPAFDQFEAPATNALRDHAGSRDMYLKYFSNT